VSDGAAGGPEVGVVIATRNRRENLLGALEQITALPERPPVIVVDNHSGDGSVAAVAERFPSVRLLALERNRGAFARNLGATELGTPFVAFSDDDSWWQAGSLQRAATVFRRYPALGLIAARILVGPQRRLDSTAALMRGPAPPGLPGPRVDGFIACGSVVRRRAFEQAGGFCERFLIGSEEELLALDMAAAGWELCYVEEVTAIHTPEPGGRNDRSWMSLRNALWTSWLRRPRRTALRDTLALAAAGGRDPAARRALVAGLRGLPWALSSRQVMRRRRD
jgi:N-acetylglucosaminyl-diphospho-decaprenol L-rhamnosyltransferase